MHSPPPRRHKPRKASIRDVAELAGVSVGSASRVINEAHNVTVETRDKVQQAIAALGYRPNHAAQSLRLRSSRTVGCLLSDVTNPLYAKLFRALEERLREAGYMMLLANSLNQVEREIEILSTFQRRGMDGVLIAPTNQSDPQVLAAVAALEMPAVLLDRDLDAPIDRVLFDHIPGMQRLVSHLAGLGHRRIALVVSESPARPMRRRIEGFRLQHEAIGLPLDERHVVCLPTGTSPAFDLVNALLAGPDRPTALISLGTTVLSDTLGAISMRGLRIPQDVSVVSLGDPVFAWHHVPPISTLRVDLQQAGDTGSQLLLARMAGDDAAPRCVTLPCQFVERQSCGPAPRRPG